MKTIKLFCLAIMMMATSVASCTKDPAIPTGMVFTNGDPGGGTSNNASKTFTANGVSFTMKYVEGGTFQMGATSEQGSAVHEDESPVHNVTLSNYYIGETEVTQALWKAVMGTNPSRFKGDNLPVESVSWNDIVNDFLPKLNNMTGKNFRLPTEAEWEFAARGGKSGGYKYAGSNNVWDVAWYWDNCSEHTHAVKTKYPNELGLYDMSGNVGEFCVDWKDVYDGSAQTNPMGPLEGMHRVTRGGYWSMDSDYCRVSCRCICVPHSASFNLGFRLVLPQ